MNSPAEQHWKHAQVFLAQRRFDLAETALRQVLAAAPNHPLAPTSMALVLDQLGRKEEALAQAREAVRQRPDYARAQFALGGLLGEREEFEAARDHALEAIRLDPRRPLYHGLLMMIHLELEEFAPALKLAELSVSVRADSAQLQCMRAVALAGMRRAQEAKQVIAECLRQYPDVLFTHLCASWVHRLLQDYDQSEVHCRRALEMGPARASSHGEIGLLRVAQGRPDEARSFLTEALRLNPWYRRARRAMEALAKREADLRELA